MRKIADKLLKVLTATVFAVLYAPIAVLIAFSFSASRYLGAWSGFTFHWYQVLFADAKLWHTVLNSAWIAVVVTIVTIVLSIPVAFAMSRYTFKAKSTISSYVYIPLIIPEIAESLTILLFYKWTGLPFGPIGIIIGQMVWFPLVYIVLRARMAGLSLRQVEEAARVLGANELQTFFRITLPLIMPGAVAGGLMMFTWSFDDYVKVAFTRGIGFETLPIKIWGMAAKGGITPELNALATVYLPLSIVLAVLYAKLSR